MRRQSAGRALKWIWESIPPERVVCADRNNISKEIIRQHCSIFFHQFVGHNWGESHKSRRRRWSKPMAKWNATRFGFLLSLSLSISLSGACLSAPKISHVLAISERATSKEMRCCAEKLLCQCGYLEVSIWHWNPTTFHPPTNRNSISTLHKKHFWTSSKLF